VRYSTYAIEQFKKAKQLADQQLRDDIKAGEPLTYAVEQFNNAKQLADQKLRDDRNKKPLFSAPRIPFAAPRLTFTEHYEVLRIIETAPVVKAKAIDLEAMKHLINKHFDATGKAIIEDLERTTRVSRAAPQVKAQADENLPQTFAELFTEPETDLPKLTAIFQEHKLVCGNGQWVGGKESRKRTLMLVATDGLIKYSGFKSNYGDGVIAPLISHYYGVTLSKRSNSNRAQDRTGLKDAVRLAFPKD
jgi:hypothetical protein